MDYCRISKSWVARHPDPIGVIEFYGGAFVGLFPHRTYGYFLQRMFDAGYTIIAVPLQMNLNHTQIAQQLLCEREIVRKTLDLGDLPHFWVGHSIGCKIIFLLEAGTVAEPDGRWNIPSASSGIRGIYDEPSLLLAPANPDTRHSIQVPLLPDILDEVGWGVRPSREEIQDLVLEKLDSLFNLMAVISFSEDTAAGNLALSRSDVGWLVRMLKRNPNFLYIELPGRHMDPSGGQISSDTILMLRLAGPLMLPVPAIRNPHCRSLEDYALDALEELGKRREEGIKKRQEEQALEDQGGTESQTPGEETSAPQKQPEAPKDKDKNQGKAESKDPPKKSGAPPK